MKQTALNSQIYAMIQGIFKLNQKEIKWNILIWISLRRSRNMNVPRRVPLLEAYVVYIRKICHKIIE